MIEIFKTSSAADSPPGPRPRLVLEAANRAYLRSRLTWLALWAGVAALGFARPLWDLARFAWGSDLYSHLFLIPVISLYLCRLKRAELAPHPRPAWGCGMAALSAGTAVVLAYWWGSRSGWRLGREDYLALMTLGFVCVLWSGAFLVLGAKNVRQLAFPAGFLVFMVPLPTNLLRWVEEVLQQRSADVAQALFALAGMPALREDTVFNLPGFSLRVAPECSGIHSSLVLFITSLVAGYLFLRAPWNRAVLALTVIPLALLRNGLRIFTIGELCVQVNPDLVNSFIHVRGGPIFFAISLVPFFLLLMWLRRSESKTILGGRSARAPSDL